MKDQFEERPRKVHLFHDQEGKTYGGPRHPQLYADTLCMGNFRSPELLSTTDPKKVTCKMCLARMAAKVAPTPPDPIPVRSARAQRFRYRRGWFGKLILQVEVTTNHMDDVGGSGYYDEWQSTSWRDARIADLPYPGIGVVD